MTAFSRNALAVTENLQPQANARESDMVSDSHYIIIPIIYSIYIIVYIIISIYLDMR